MDQPALWAGNVGNSWRTTADLELNWASVLSNIDNVILSYTFRSLNILLCVIRIMNMLIKQDLVVGMILIVSESLILSNPSRSFDV